MFDLALGVLAESPSCFLSPSRGDDNDDDNHTGDTASQNKTRLLAMLIR